VAWSRWPSRRIISRSSIYAVSGFKAIVARHTSIDALDFFLCFQTPTHHQIKVYFIVFGICKNLQGLQLVCSLQICSWTHLSQAGAIFSQSNQDKSEQLKPNETQKCESCHMLKNKFFTIFI
jgi:hypothetical protein